MGSMSGGFPSKEKFYVSMVKKKAWRQTLNHPMTDTQSGDNNPCQVVRRRRGINGSDDEA